MKLIVMMTRDNYDGGGDNHSATWKILPVIMPSCNGLWERMIDDDDDDDMESQWYWWWPLMIPVMLKIILMLKSLFEKLCTDVKVLEWEGDRQAHNGRDSKWAWLHIGLLYKCGKYYFFFRIIT